MGRILSLDTTSEFASLALVEGGAVVEEVMLHSTDGFGHILYPHLEALLARRGWDLASVDCFAAASGPGSFTGVRVGLAAVKGLAEGAGKPRGWSLESQGDCTVRVREVAGERDRCAAG